MKHTPAPWGFGATEELAICGKGGTGFVIHRPHSTTEFERADLKFIVHAVNSHDSLLATLKQLTIRFPIEHGTQTHPPKCKCLQFEDNDFCRHLDALGVIQQVEKGL